MHALALMEQNDTSYVFMIDDAEYKGVLSILSIARRMAELAACRVMPEHGATQP